jgi:hypothetical protein
MLAPEPLAGLRVALWTTRPDADFDLLRRAYEVAARCHQGQRITTGDTTLKQRVRRLTQENWVLKERLQAARSSSRFAIADRRARGPDRRDATTP